MNIFFYRHKGRPPNPAEITAVPAEKRLFPRLKCQLEVSVLEFRTRKEACAHCLDISPGGMRMQIGKVLYIGEKLELWVHLNDGLEPIHRFAKVIWSKQLAPFTYSCGIKFESSLGYSPYRRLS